MPGELPSFTPEDEIVPIKTAQDVVPDLLAYATPESTVVQEHIVFDRKAFDKQWQKDKHTQRLANLAIAHGYVHTASGRTYYDHGKSSKPRRR